MQEKFDIPPEARKAQGTRGLGAPSILAIFLALAADIIVIIIASNNGLPALFYLVICGAFQGLIGYSIYHKVDEGAKIDRENSPDAGSLGDWRLKIIDILLAAPIPSTPAIFKREQFGSWLIVAGVGAVIVGLVWMILLI